MNINTAMKQLTVLTIIISTFLLTSCGTYFYYPMQHNVMQFNKKSDFVAAYGLSEGEMSYNLGYAFTNNLAFLTSFRQFSLGYHEFFYDNEISFFNKSKNNLFYSCNLGYGIGASQDEDNYYSIIANRKFLLPAIGYKSKFIDISYSARLSRVNYEVEIYNYYSSSTTEEYYNEHKNNGSITQTTYGEYRDFRIREELYLYDVGKKPFYFIEPAITLGLGYKNIKFQCQFISCNQISSGKIKFIENTTHLSLRMTCNINDTYNFINNIVKKHSSPKE